MSAQELRQVQKQTQNLVLAPQLRQSLKILQAPALELRTTILEELQSNPTLEELPIEGESLKRAADRGVHRVIFLLDPEPSDASLAKLDALAELAAKCGNA